MTQAGSAPFAPLLITVTRMNQGEHQRVLEFWRMLELFTPQKVPDITRRPVDLKVIEWRPSDPLPWKGLPPAEPRKEWQHHVYLGAYELADIYETLRLLFAQDPEAHDLRTPGRSACGGLVINQDGVLVGESVLLSSCARALGTVNAGRHTEPAWSVGFEDAADAFSMAVVEKDESRQDQAQSEEPVPVDEEFLRWMHRLARTVSSVGEISTVPSDLVVIRSRQVHSTTAADLSDFDFMNSFFLDDLRTVQDACADGNLGAALEQYLTPGQLLDMRHRVDVVRKPVAVNAATGATSTPAGRWPSNPEHPLALSQQFAVNNAIDRLGSGSGLMGVNGPPGTGKTTLLRDLIAGNVVERAGRLAELRHPRDAFTSEIHRWKSGDYPRRVPQLRSELTGFEMVVASSNNAAVENVTEEIPAVGAIDAPSLGNVDHFTELASNILRRDGQPQGNDTGETGTEDETHAAEADAAWGLVAAKLGNKRNRSRFVTTFWFGKGFPGPDRGMSHILTEWAAEPLESWSTATQAFQDAAARVEVLRQQRIHAEQRITRLVGVRKDLEQASSALEPVAAEVSRAQELFADMTRDLSATVNACEQADRARRRHLDAKPGALETLFTFGAATGRWRESLAPLDGHLRQQEHERAVLEGHCQRAEQDVTMAYERQHDLLRRCASLAEVSERLGREIDADAERFKESYPSAERVGDARELRAPWLDAAYNEARSDLFIAALTLHRAFIRQLAGDMKSWMGAVCDVVQGKVPRSLPPEAVLAAWQLFSIFVPVVSTTFASMGRMFRGLEQESLGCLLIDEAGQCAPQQAVGAMWRAQRVLAVGDPMQLQPVVPMPPKAVNDMATTFGIEDEWVPPRASVQTLTDRTSHFGTTLRNGDDPVWVSSPLRVHRRCDDPMFSVSNQIAYDGLMISAVHRPPAREDLYTADPVEQASSAGHEPGRFEVPGGSYWDDVPSVATSDSHLQPQEIERAQAAVTYWHDTCGIPYDEIFAVSPFRAVADELEKMAQNNPGMRGGTVHTAQGREADVVLLVLGTSDARDGARAWAASTPNLLNVAVSRARRRLYVIGSYENWSDQKYFSTLAHHLPRKRSPAPR